ncbi:DNA starvation/stationary phase protection protein [Glycomyces sp. TRM65418]|uniref:Dps family protein n=1 Tax=Glycomyces sp. TRM65418 TaxID=2867006 RepID=UPI001CE535DF|nr:DNA starvation/stationary phase protection protein [Glycomyces sp. TRM65418]MCC3765465.1 DNA starvation/stationary phase protection protein [Glycomyces sp. TRM65418]QZD55074.1 DNA starvation/stationary phase protection protein [Glycomyces sp. TRM65418]
MTTVRSSLSDEHRETTAKALQGALVDLIDLSLVGKQAHWNVYGKNFRSLHLQLDEIVTWARASADLVAERAIAIGVSADGRASTVAENSSVPRIHDGQISDTEAISLFIEAYGAIIANMRERIEVTDSSDPVTQDLLIGITAELEKQSWMFQAELG